MTNQAIFRSPLGGGLITVPTLTVIEAAAKLGVTANRVRRACLRLWRLANESADPSKGGMPPVTKIGRDWVIVDIAAVDAELTRAWAAKTDHRKMGKSKNSD